jgi:hypothetical protein
MVCAYHGGNGGFCTRTPLSEVSRIDQLAKDMCEHGGPDASIPHVYTGEAAALGYECHGGRMTRRPYAEVFNVDGYMLSEWSALR